MSKSIRLEFIQGDRKESIISPAEYQIPRLGEAVIINDDVRGKVAGIERYIYTITDDADVIKIFIK